MDIRKSKRRNVSTHARLNFSQSETSSLLRGEGAFKLCASTVGRGGGRCVINRKDPNPIFGSFILVLWTLIFYNTIPGTMNKNYNSWKQILLKVSFFFTFRKRQSKSGLSPTPKIFLCAALKIEFETFWAGDTNKQIMESIRHCHLIIMLRFLVLIRLQSCRRTLLILFWHCRQNQLRVHLSWFIFSSFIKWISVYCANRDHLFF